LSTKKLATEQIGPGPRALQQNCILKTSQTLII